MVIRKDFAIYDETDQQQVVKAAIRRLGLDDKQLTPRNVLSRISWAKNHMLDPQEIYLQSGDPKTEQIAHVYEIYRQELRKANALDFDDLLLETVRLLKSSERFANYYSRRFEYVLVDEYQDTNRPQYELMRLLAGDHHNICAVGDEDQSIYSWRGADIRNILDFERTFPKRRSSGWNRTIDRRSRFWKRLRRWWRTTSSARARTCGRRARADRRSATTKLLMARTKRCSSPTTSAIPAQARRTATMKPRAAVLYRTNSQSRLFEEALRRYGCSTRCGRLLVLRARRNQGHDRAI